MEELEIDVMEMTPPTGKIFKLKLNEEGYGIINVEEDAMTPLNANGNDTTV